MPTDDIGELIRKCCYPAPYVNHPDIGHVSMVDKIFPYLKPEVYNFEQYMSHYQAAYLVISRDFDSYLEFLEEEHWKNFKNKHKLK